MTIAVDLGRKATKQTNKTNIHEDTCHSVRPQHFCFHYFIFILYCSHIADVHFLFCAHFMNIFSFLWGADLRHFFLVKMLQWCLVCVIYNSNSFHSFYIQTLQNDCSHIEDVHHLFSAHLINVFLFLRGVELRHFFPS